MGKVLSPQFYVYISTTLMEENTQAQQSEMVDINVFLKDPALVEKINNRINAYNRRVLPKEVADKFPQARFRRTPENSIIEAGNFNAMWFIDEFLRIISKTSSQPKSIRICVEFYVVTSMRELYYENLKKQKENGNKEESGSKSTHTE